MKHFFIAIWAFDALFTAGWLYYMYHLIRHPGKASPAEAYMRAKLRRRKLDRELAKILADSNPRG